MRFWKVLGVATLAGVVAAGVVAQRKRRTYRAIDTDELRSRLHQRLADAEASPSPASGRPTGPGGGREGRLGR